MTYSKYLRQLFEGNPIDAGQQVDFEQTFADRSHYTLGHNLHPASEMGEEVDGGNDGMGAPADYAGAMMPGGAGGPPGAMPPGGAMPDDQLQQIQPGMPQPPPGMGQPPMQEKVMRDTLDLYLDALLDESIEELTEGPFDWETRDNPQTYGGLQGPQRAPPSVAAGGPAAIANWQQQAAVVSPSMPNPYRAGVGTAPLDFDSRGAPTGRYAGGGGGRVGGGAGGGGANSFIRQVQQQLNSQGAKLAVDGLNGPQTQAAIKQFQTKNGMPANGVWNKDTQAAFKAGGSSGSAAPAAAGPAAAGPAAGPTGVNTPGRGEYGVGQMVPAPGAQVPGGNMASPPPPAGSKDDMFSPAGKAMTGHDIWGNAAPEAGHQTLAGRLFRAPGDTFNAALGRGGEAAVKPGGETETQHGSFPNYHSVKTTAAGPAAAPQGSPANPGGVGEYGVGIVPAPGAQARAGNAAVARPSAPATNVASRTSGDGTPQMPPRAAAPGAAPAAAPPARASEPAQPPPGAGAALSPAPAPTPASYGGSGTSNKEIMSSKNWGLNWSDYNILHESDRTAAKRARGY